jgi:predicted enzyme involved in methoxymalonyl-ACP biosynthesis
MEGEGVAFTMKTRLADQYSDFGLISVVIARERPEASAQVWEIDTWLMSCRVLGRRVEEAVLVELVRAARTNSVTRLAGHYIPTQKNALVADHYEKLGFVRMSAASDRKVEYWLDVAGYKEPELPFLTE